MSVDLSGLERFKRVLEETRVNIKSSKKNPKIERIIDISMEELRKAYSGRNVRIVLKKTKEGFTIYVKDNNIKNPSIAFDEFGTGFYAKKYPGKLPTQRITFQSAGKKRSTQGWVYYYDNLDTKVTHGGMKGWVTPNGAFHIGQNPNSTMYNACKVIRTRLRSENL